jgi:hypothetical protein
MVKPADDSTAATTVIAADSAASRATGTVAGTITLGQVATLESGSHYYHRPVGRRAWREVWCC